jgi:DNA-binding PadR family transcriptional regulator
MSNISESEAVILGLLYDSPKYGYEIEQIIEEQSMRDWTEIAFSSIYYVLKKLEEKKMVTSEIKSSEKNRTRKIFTISKEGKKTLEEIIREKIRTVAIVKYPIDIGIAYLGILSKDEIIQNFQKYRKDLEEKVKCYQDLKQYLTDQGCPLNRMQLAERPLFLYKAEMEWANQFLKELKNWK